MGRIKITGYIDPEELTAEQRDDHHPSGLSTRGYEDITTDMPDYPFTISGLMDVDVALVGDDE